MAIDITFSPGYGTGVSISATTSSTASAVKSGSQTLCLTNRGTNDVFVRSGMSDAIATAADYCLLAGQQVTVTRKPEHTHVAVLAATGTVDVHVMVGEGF